MGNLDFNADEHVDDANAGGFDIIPAGTKAPAWITESEWKDNKNGGQRLAITVEIIDGPYKGRKVWDALNLQSSPKQDPEKAAKMKAIAAATLADICFALGLRGLANHEDMRGKPLLVELKVTPPQNGYEARNEVKQYYTPDGQKRPRGASDDRKERKVAAATPASTGEKAPWAR